MIPTALNYAPAAIEDLAKWSKRFAGHPASQAIQALAGAIRSGEKFLLPDNADLLEVPDVQEHYRDLLRLPYPSTVLEFCTDPERNGGSDKGIVLCVDSEHFAGTDVPLDTIFFTPLFWSASQRLWHPTAWLFQFSPQSMTLLDGKIVNSVVAIDLVPEMMADMDEATRERETQLNMQFALDAVIEFCLTINCQNVDRYQLDPPAKLNAKRTRNGREPLDSYKVLTIPGDAGGALGSNGDHEGPRMHLRRGHLRRLSSGSIVWVRHALVGNPDKGVVDKSYKVIAKRDPNRN